MSHAMRLPNMKPSVIAGHWSKHHQETKHKTARADAGLPKLVEPMVGINENVKRPDQLK
jgi:hypothetical protein